MGFINSNDFYNTLSKEHKVLDSYATLNFAHNNHQIYKCNLEKAQTKVDAINLFPSYLSSTFNDAERVNIKTIPQKKIVGYGINIKGNQDFETFFKNEFSKSFRSNTRRFVNRLEACFNTNYKMFFGNINKVDYDFLMSALHTMLTNRFNQREESNKILKNWDYYLESVYKNINSKKASLFVIYHDEKPIQISLNYHFDKILFISIPSYNIDYAKFSLGNISIYKILDWAVTNSYEIMDLEYGYLEYKRRWSNYIYEFNHHVIYSKNNIKATLLASVEILKLKLKNLLKSLNIDKLVKNLKGYFYKQKTTHIAIAYKTESIDFINTNNLETLNINSPQLINLKKIIFDFLFVNKTHISDLKIYEIAPLKEYVFCGKTKSQKIIIT